MTLSSDSSDSLPSPINTIALEGVLAEDPWYEQADKAPGWHRFRLIHLMAYRGEDGEKKTVGVDLTVILRRTRMPSGLAKGVRVICFGRLLAIDEHEHALFARTVHLLPDRTES